MINSFKYFYLSALLVMSLKMKGQTNDNNIAISVTNLHKAKKAIAFDVNIENASEKGVSIFKPNLDYVNYGLLSICIRNLVTGEKYYFKNGKTGNLDNIYLKRQDYVVLDKGQKSKVSLKLPVDKFSPRVAEGKYAVEFILDYSIVNFTFPNNIGTPAFKGKTSTIDGGNFTL